MASSPSHERWLSAAQLIRRFANGSLTNDEFETAYEDIQGDDQVLFEVGLMIWGCYDDLSTHRLDGPFTLTPEGAARLERCALFLETQPELAAETSGPLPRLT